MKQDVDLKICNSSKRELQTLVQTDICRDKPALLFHCKSKGERTKRETQKEERKGKEMRWPSIET